MSATRILLADDHALFRRGLCALLHTQPDWHVCGEAATGLEAIEKAKSLKPDIVILDISMPGLNGLQTAPQILREVPRVEILVLSMHYSDEIVNDVLRAGARGYLLKSDAEADLFSALQALRQHKPFLSSPVAEMVIENYSDRGRIEEQRMSYRGLTARERQIAQLLSEGKSNKEIAAAFAISIRTIETHRSNLMRKLNAHSLGELLRTALREKVIQV